MNSSSESLRAGNELAELPVPPALDHAWLHGPAPHAGSPATLQVWDPALRIFHWSLAASVTAAIITGEIGGPWIEWHGRLGQAIAGLLGFRLAWGVLGPDTARFTRFVRGPAAIRAYLRGQWQGIGHNPLGALSVVALLLLAAVQVCTGLFANDDIAFQGPLAWLVSSEWSDRAGALHQKLSWGLIALVGLHLAAIAWYRLARRQDLVLPMITGVQAIPAEPSLPVRQLSWSRTRLAIALAAGVLTVAGASGRVLSSVPAATVTATPPALAAGTAASAARPAW